MQDVVYLNHAGTSWPKPSHVVHAVREVMDCEPSTWPDRFDEAHQLICREFGVQRSEQLLLTPGCTSSLSTAITSLDLTEQSRALTSCWEHHALDAPLQQLAERKIVVKRIPPSCDTCFDLNRLEDSLKSGGVSLVAVTAACNVTGDLLPVEEIIELARRFGAMTLIDAAQVAGWYKVDLEDLGADIVAFGGHKALQAPWGIGALYMADSARMKCTSATCELPIIAPQSNRPETTDVPVSPRPGYCDVGSVDQFSLAGLKASVASLGKPDNADRLKVARLQASRIRAAISANAHVRLYGLSDVEQRLPTIAFNIRGIDSSTVAAKLRDKGIIVGSGLQCSPQSHQTLETQTQGVVRISVGVNQPDTQIDRVNAVLQELAPN